jgi:hypothetical protein
MKTIFGLRGYQYLARVGTFLIMVALIGGMVGCGGSDEYDLTITSTGGGSVTTPGEGIFTYPAGMTVNLVATPDAGYPFMRWAGDVGTIPDVNAAATTITMNGDYSITANFEETYYLTIFSGNGGSVITPGEGTFAYAPGTVVDLVACPDPGRRFLAWANDTGTVADIHDPTTTITVNGDYSITAGFPRYYSTISGGGGHTVGVDFNGKVIAAGAVGFDYGQCNIQTWNNILQIEAGGRHTVGLKSDGTVVAVGGELTPDCLIDVGGWTDIEQVAAGEQHTVGLKSDGTVVAVGRQMYGVCDVGNWTDIIQVAAGDRHTVGLRSDGTVVAAGCGNYLTDCYQVDVGGWTDIVQVGAAWGHTVGLKSDGTVVAAVDQSFGMNYGQGNVGTWTDIVQVAAGGSLTVGLKKDGTVVAVGDNQYGQLNVDSWTDIVQVAAGFNHALGVKSDGTVVATGPSGGSWPDFGQCNVGGWDLTP